MKIYSFLILSIICSGIIQSCSTSKQLPSKLADTYYGFLPCADCPGISYSLDLENNGHYYLTMDYIDRESTFESEGKFTYDNNKVFLYTDGNVTSQFEFEGDKLIYLDGDGNRITTNLASSYILYKGDSTKSKMPEEWGTDQNSAIYKGTGNEPFWMVLVNKNSLYFKGLMAEELEFEVPIISTNVSDDGHTMEYSGKDGNHELLIRIVHERCQDNMSGFYFSTTLQVEMTSANMEKQLLSGCGDFIDQYRLNGNWILDKIDGSDITTSAPTLSINLPDAKIAGNAGCNRYFGSIAEVTTSSIKFSGAGSTKMACPDMSIENKYMEFLNQSDLLWSINDSGQLFISSGAGEFVFSRSEDI